MHHLSENFLKRQSDNKEVHEVIETVNEIMKSKEDHIIFSETFSTDQVIF